MKLLILLCLVALPAAAQDIFPVRTGGEYLFRFQQPCPEVDPQLPQGVALTLERISDGQPILECFPTPQCETIYETRIGVSAAPGRQDVKGFAWADAECLEEKSEPSDATAHVFPGVNPRGPKLEP